MLRTLPTLNPNRSSALLTLSPFALAAMVALSACNTAADKPADQSASSKTQAEAPAIVQPGAPGQGSTVVSSVPAFRDAKFTEADTTFMQGMIHHHNQALLMVAMIPTHTKTPELIAMGQKIQLSQSGEMQAMKDWLVARKQNPPVIMPDGSAKMEMPGMAGHMMEMGPMPGMLTAAEMKALDAARGATFDELFLTGMIKHHKGALGMVAEIREAGGGKETNIGDFLNQVDNDQRMEIVRMYGLLGKPVEK